ncbi:hypothetical protein PI124_g3095 [Phytophthora idaei]|nr:hypothetical protein PI125_g2456 [Phytophthora idaei]KAG3170376.1 hypothetical protein PI126_g2406 [Phytophthora idaei]KAG3252323.1 hypothetical protein PI124_g3095 [Phytophthora idaei]
MFYETDTCRTGGKYFYIPDVADVVGTHTFDSPQAIRSIMFGKGDDYARRPSFIYGECFQELGVVTNEATTN